MEKKTTFISEQEELAYRQMEQKVELETLRYKQDCRKRALDLAHSEANRYIPQSEFNQISQQRAINADALKLADKYYNWLISIP